MTVIAMKILFVANGTILCRVSSGNTCLHLFGNIENVSLFTRGDAPSKKIKAAYDRKDNIKLSSEWYKENFQSSLDD